MLKSINKYILNFRYAFRVQKPFLVGRLIATYLKILFFRTKPLRYVDFAIDYGCNLKCEHCFATALERKDRQFISPEEFGRVCREAMKLGAVNFSFQGGEPTMFAKLYDYIQACESYKNLISVTTNAVLIDEQLIAKLKKAQVDILTVSLDSGISEEHDRFRGVPGSFDKTLNAIRLALKMGLKVTIGTTAYHQNIHSEGFIRLLDIAHDLGVIIFIALATPLGRWKGNQEVLITSDDRKYINNLLKKYPLLRTDFEANYINWGCGAVKEILYLTPYGDVFACPFLHFSLGNVREMSLKEIRDKALSYNFFKNYHKLCLSAEDRDFMRKVSEYNFYNSDGSVVKIEQIFAEHKDNVGKQN